MSMVKWVIKHEGDHYFQPEDFFFFSSRRRHTRYWRDWSSDVCSSDLVAAFRATLEELESADLLLHALDISSGRAAERAEVVQTVLGELGVGDRPMLTVMKDRKSVV